MYCRFVFAFWWSIFVGCVWWHLNQPLQRWTVDRHQTKTVSLSATLRPIIFGNTSVIWLDMWTDRVDLDLERNISVNAGTVSIKSMQINVYENSFRDKVMEMYPVTVPDVPIEDVHLEFEQDDIHLSPFRRLVVTPRMQWDLGSDEDYTMERAGHFKDGFWIEGRDATQLGAGALFAWCMGVVFLTVMRRTGAATTIVVKRQKRIFKDAIRG